MDYRRRFLSVCLATGLWGCLAEPSDRGEPPLEGAWTILEASRIEPSSDRTPVPVSAGLILFTDGRYSMVWSSADGVDAHFLTGPADDRRRPPRASWDLSDADRISRFNATVVNAGVYEISGTTLTTVPNVALVPEYIGGRATHEYELVGDTLLLTVINLVSRDGTPHPLYAGGAQFAYRLLRLR